MTPLDSSEEESQTILRYFKNIEKQERKEKAEQQEKKERNGKKTMKQIKS